MTPPDPAPPDSPATASRPAGPGPASTRALAPAGPHFAPTRFDPLAEERSRLDALGNAAFDVCHPALALRAVLLVQAALALVALGGAATLQDWLGQQAALAFGGVTATLLWLVVICALRRMLRVLPSAARAGVVLALGALAAGLAWAPLAWAGLVDANGLRLTAVLLAGLALAGVLWAWLDLRSRIWHPANASARLAELQSRIRPHFLFNALNTAIALVRVDPARAEGVLEDLAQLFRVALADVGASVTLEEEIELARRYLDIEALRFGPRLAVQWHIDPAVHGARVPPLVLQPLVENAVRHGIEPAAGGGRVSVRALRQRGQVWVTVSNTLGDEPGKAGHGMALHNVRERLRLLHDVAAQCDVWRDTVDGAEMFHARIVLPAP